jgi:hypothetical protein
MDTTISAFVGIGNPVSILFNLSHSTFCISCPAAKKSPAIISAETGLAVEHSHFTIDRPIRPHDFYAARYYSGNV